MIGFLDSGVGGLNVLISCAKVVNADYVFLCDNKFAPYGNKSKKKLQKITESNVDYLIKHYNIDTLVVACNTLSYTIGKELKNKYKNLKIILTKFDCKKINQLKKPILFFATKNTIKNNKFIKYKIKENNYKALYIRDLAKKIDNNLNNLNNLNKILKKHFLNKKYFDTKTIVLGCTHFKTIKNNIQNILPGVSFFEYEQDVANKLKQVAKQKEFSTFNIVLTSFDYAKYLQLKNYLYNNLK